MMSAPRRNPPARRVFVNRQRGVILFIALIAMVTIMLAATALIRSVDTATVIAGNLAFKQAATASGDGGLEVARAWISASSTADPSDPWTNPSYVLNQSIPANGYYSHIDPAMNFSLDATWATGASAGIPTDQSGNSVRYIIQRMCRSVDQVVSDDDCIFGNMQDDNGGMAGGEVRPNVTRTKTVMQRITVRVKGPRETVSYIQGFMY